MFNEYVCNNPTLQILLSMLHYTSGVIAVDLDFWDQHYVDFGWIVYWTKEAWVTGHLVSLGEGREKFVNWKSHKKVSAKREVMKKRYGKT